MCVAEEEEAVAAAAGSRNFLREPDTARGCDANVYVVVADGFEVGGIAAILPLIVTNSENQ